MLSRLAGSVSELDAFLSHEYQKVKVVEELYLGIDELARLKNEIDKYGNRKATMQEKMQAIQQRIEKDRQAVESIKKSEKLGDLEDLKQKVQQRRHQVQYYLRHLEKPFMKFRNLAGGPGYSLFKEEVEKLEQYLKDPFIALATETQGFPVLKSILKKVAVAMNAGKLKLKSSRLKKAQEKIDEIVNKNALDDLRLECEHIFSLTQKLVSSEETLWAEKRLKQLEQRLGVLQRRKKAADIRLDALEREHKQLLNKVEQRKSELEETVVDILGKQVSIKLP